MIRWKNLNGRRGTITVFVAIVLIPVCIVQCALIDCARGISFGYSGKERVSIALSSILASFDSRLQDTYGLFGVNRVRVGNIEDTFSGYLSGGDFPAEDFTLQMKAPLSQPEVLQKQIVERMKLRTPLRGSAWFLEQMGLIEDAEAQGQAALLLAKGNELLRLSEEKLERLEQLLEGFFPGDTACVNGYTKAHWLYTERETVLVTLQVFNADDGDETERLILAHEEYRNLLLIYCEYHNQSIGVIRELQELSGQIHNLITQARNLCETDQGLSSMIGRLQSQAGKIANGSNMAGLEQNLQLLTEKVSALEWNLEMMRDLSTYLADPTRGNTFMDNIQKALSLNGIRDDFNTAMLDVNSNGESAQMPESDWQLPEGGDEDFEIPEKIYATLPSVLQGVEVSACSEWIDFQDLSELTSFFDTHSFLSGIQQVGTQVYEDVLLNDYIMETMDSRMDIGGYFTGEIEYILGGHASFRENEESVQQKLFFLRFVLNLTHVLADSGKRTLAQELGCGVALALSGGVGGDFYAILIMCTWAACESALDLSELTSGEKVPLIKTNETWQTSIDGLLERDEGETTAPSSVLDLSYEDYLMILLIMEDRETKLLRIADVIEVNMTQMTGLRYKLSGVYTALEASVCYAPDYLLFDLIPGRRQSDYGIQIQQKQSY